MNFELFINFDGNCREAAEFYAKVFKSRVSNLMTYEQAPSDPDHPLSGADKNRVMYADVQIGDMTLMLMDMPSGLPLVKGNNISPTISLNDKEEIRRLFDELKEGGTVNQELSSAFFSELYGMVTDKFGIGWQILFYTRT